MIEMPMMSASFYRSSHTCARHGMLLLLWCFGILAKGDSVTLAQDHPEADSFGESVRPFLNQYCLECHGSGEPEGGFRVDNLPVDVPDGSDLGHWIAIADRVTRGEMPPEGHEPRPAPAETNQFVAKLNSRIRDWQSQLMAQQGPVSFHRLSRAEYANTVNDLLGVAIRVDGPGGLVADDQFQGLQRIGSVMSMSPSHIERYYSVASRIVNEAFPEVLPEPGRWHRTAVDLAGGEPVYNRQRLDDVREAGLSPKIRLDLWPGQVVGIRHPEGEPLSAGIYRFSLRVSGLVSADGIPPHLVFRDEQRDCVLFECDVVAPEDEPVEVGFTCHLPEGPVHISICNQVLGPPILTRISQTNRRPFLKFQPGDIPWQIPLMDPSGLPVCPCVIVDSAEWEGPLVSDEVAALRHRFFPDSWSDSKSIDSALDRFLTAAFRRPASLEEVEGLAELYQAEVSRGESPLSAYKSCLTAVLCSARFVFLIEGSPVREGTELDSWELAARLSYFLWGTMPDTRLAESARQNRLADPNTLSREVDRMMSDSRSSRWTEAFATQWLQLDRVGSFPPDTGLYPEYDSHLERSMIRESREFLTRVFRDNLPVSDLLDSNWTMVNARLARHYGIEGIEGDHFRLVPLGKNGHRGGLLTQAGILSLTSDGTRHRPVHRGVWILETIVGESVPPPPANVEPIAPNPVDSDKSTFRSKLEAHLANADCASCHRKIDPLGLAFENYDAIGRWRERELVPTGTGPDPLVDSSGALADGRVFLDASGLRNLLAQDIDRFARVFVSRLTSFAIRRTLTAEDDEELQRIVSGLRETDYRLQDIVRAIILSPLFRMR